MIFLCKKWQNHHHLHNCHHSSYYYLHNHHHNNIHYHQHILNVKTELPMWHHIFFKGFLSSVYHSNNNYHHYHYYYHYHHYYNLPRHHHRQNINYYFQINIHIKTPVLYKVPKLRKMAISYPFLPLFCRNKFVKKTNGA